MSMSFSELASKHFHFLPRDYGFNPISQTDSHVRWENGQVVVELIYDSGRSFEVSLSIGNGSGQAGTSKANFDLGEIVRLTNLHCNPLSTFFQASNERKLDWVLHEMAKLLRDFGSRMLRGDTASFERLAEQRLYEGEQHAKETHLREVRREVEQAWKKSDHGRVVALCGPCLAELSPAERMRYDYSLRHATK
jgi:hypothetical protein